MRVSTYEVKNDSQKVFDDAGFAGMTPATKVEVKVEAELSVEEYRALAAAFAGQDVTEREFDLVEFLKSLPKKVRP